MNTIQEGVILKQEVKCELYNDNFQNFKRYGIPKAQLVIADIPFVKKAKEKMLNFKNKDKTLFDYLTEEKKQ